MKLSKNMIGPRNGVGRFAVVVTCFIVACAILSGYAIIDWWTCLDERGIAAYVGRDQCVECHREQVDLFHGSHHDLAMDFATAETVLGKFDGTVIEHFGIQSRVFMDGERFMIHTDGPDGEMHDYEVKYVFGVTPLQQYMVEIEPATKAFRSTPVVSQNIVSKVIGKVQVLRVSWNALSNEWFYLSPPDVKERLDPTDPLHWTGSSQCWNTNCAECHSTNLNKNFETLSSTYHTTFSEMDVSCEACHGPASLHVEMARSKSIFWDRKLGYGLNQLKNQPNVKQVETCAPCHSRRGNLVGSWAPGCEFDSSFACQLIAEPLYYKDGQIRDEDYVYGSFIQSKMYANNIRCNDCHDPHSLKLKSTGNTLCTSCHQHPAAKYDTPEHHHHATGSKGASCVECHMPATTYMDVDARRDHSLRVPRPDMSVSLGTPNACTGCHLDTKKLPGEIQGEITQYLDWFTLAEKGNEEVRIERQRVDVLMKEAFVDWYGAENATRNEHYWQLATLLSRQADDRVQQDLEFLEDFSVPAMIRASGLAHLANADDNESLQLARRNLKSPDPKLVLSALGRVENQLYNATQGGDGTSDLLKEIGVLLEHESPTVQMEAARFLSSLPTDLERQIRIPEFTNKLERALDLWKRSLALQNDRPTTHMILGSWYVQKGQLNSAADEFRTAIRIDPNFVGPRINLCEVLDYQLRELTSRAQSQRDNMSAIEQTNLRNNMSRLQLEIQRLRNEEHELLAVDIKRSAGIPRTDSLHFRYAMSCYLMQDNAGLRKHLGIAYEMAPKNETYLLALVEMHRLAKEWNEAKKYLKELLELTPQNPQYLQLERDVQLEASAGADGR